MIPALFVANYIIEYADKKGYEISNLKLQNILFYINARNLVEHDSPLFDDKIKKWSYGFRVLKVYREFKWHGAWPLEKEDVCPRIYTMNDEPDNFQMKVKDYNKGEIPYKAMIEDTVDVLQAYDSFDLADKVCELVLWKKPTDNYNMDAILNFRTKYFFDSHKEEQIWLK